MASKNIKPLSNSPKRALLTLIFSLLAIIILATVLVYFRKKTTFTYTEPAAATSPKTVIDMLVLYTPASEVKVPNMRAKVLKDVQDMNQALHFSKTNIQVELTGLRKVSYVEGSASNELYFILQDMTNRADNDLPEAFTVRDSLGADIVMTYVHVPNGMCGTTNLRTKSNTDYYEQFAHGVVNVRDGCNSGNSYTLAHEFTHMVGMHDSNQVVDSYYAVGTDVVPFVNTTLGIEEIVAATLRRRIRLYSNPDLTVEGARFGTTGRSNSVRLLNLYGPQMASYRNRTSTVKTVFNPDRNYVNILSGQTSVNVVGSFASPLTPTSLSYAVNWNYTTNSFTTITPSSNRWSISVPTSQISGNNFKLIGIVNGRTCEWDIYVTRNSTTSTSTVNTSTFSTIPYPTTTGFSQPDCAVGWTK